MTGESLDKSAVPVAEPVEVTATATQLQGPQAVEEAALFYLRKAITHYSFVKEKAPSRSNSVAMQRLDEAELWAERDIREKREAQPKEENDGGE